MGRIIFSEFVETELAAIWDYIAFDNMDAADRFLDAAHSTFQELARMPDMGRAREFPEAQLAGLRSFRVRGFDNYLIFYKPIPEGVEIFHVIHGARDLERFWKEEEGGGDFPVATGR